MKTISITSYNMINAKLARVIVATTGEVTPDELHESIVDKLEGQGAPVADSFQKIEGDDSRASYVGFVKNVPQVKAVTPKELTAGYTAVLASNSNALISKSDQSIWELKEGAAGKYLVRKGDEDLSSIIASSVNHYAVAPKEHHVRMPMPNPKQLVAYVTPEGSLDYGFVTRTSSAHDIVQIVASNAKPQNVSMQMLTAAYDIDIDPEVHHLAAINVSPSVKDQMITYYSNVFNYAPDYLDKIIQMIND